jgi:hypothetical protein
MFFDPAYKPEYADIYMKALLGSCQICPSDIELIPDLIKAFIAKDLLDYCRYDNPPKTDLSRLTTIYDGCLERVNEYFAIVLSSSGRVSQFIAARSLE